MSMQHASPKAKFLQRNREFVIFALIVCLVAVIFAHSDNSTPRVTISDIALDDSRKEVEAKLGQAHFNAAAKSGTVEYWAKPGEDNLYVTYDEHSRVQRLSGGIAQVNGSDAGTWTQERLLQALGPPAHSSLRRVIGQESFPSLSYPRYRLLVERQDGKTTFLLFRAPEKI